MKTKQQKYKQTVIPSVSIEAYTDLSAYIRNYYLEHLQGKTVINQHLQMPIFFGSVGKNELSYGRALYAKKASVVQCLETLMEMAEYNNFGERKPTDKPSVHGYFNFKAKVYIDGKLEHVRISVLFKNNKAYYNHEINIAKNKKTSLVAEVPKVLQCPHKGG